MDLIEKQDEVIHDVVSATDSSFKHKKILLIEHFRRQKFSVNIAFLGEADRITEIIEERGIITMNKLTGVSELTNLGKQIAELKDGWLGYWGAKNICSLVFLISFSQVGQDATSKTRVHP